MSNSLPSTSFRTAPLRLFVQPLPSMDTPLLPRGLPQPLPSSAAGHSTPPASKQQEATLMVFTSTGRQRACPTCKPWQAEEPVFPRQLVSIRRVARASWVLNGQKERDGIVPCLFAWSSASSSLCCGGWSRRCMCMLVSRQTKQRCAPIRH